MPDEYEPAQTPATAWPPSTSPAPASATCERVVTFAAGTQGRTVPRRGRRRPRPAACAATTAAAPPPATLRRRVAGVAPTRPAPAPARSPGSPRRPAPRSRSSTPPAPARWRTARCWPTTRSRRRCATAGGSPRRPPTPASTCSCSASCGVGAEAAAAAVVAAPPAPSRRRSCGRVIAPGAEVDDDAWMIRCAAVRDAMHRIRRQPRGAQGRPRRSSAAATWRWRPALLLGATVAADPGADRRPGRRRGRAGHPRPGRPGPALVPAARPRQRPAVKLGADVLGLTPGARPAASTSARARPRWPRCRCCAPRSRWPPTLPVHPALAGRPRTSPSTDDEDVDDDGRRPSRSRRRARRPATAARGGGGRPRCLSSRRGGRASGWRSPRSPSCRCAPAGSTAAGRGGRDGPARRSSARCSACWPAPSSLLSAPARRPGAGRRRVDGRGRRAAHPRPAPGRAGRHRRRARLLPARRRRRSRS